MELNININDISETAFLTLQCHAIDAGSRSPILNDLSSIKTLNVIQRMKGLKIIQMKKCQILKTKRT